MKKRACVFLLWVSLILCLGNCSQNKANELLEQIEAVENNLRMPFVIKGDPASGLALMERMEHHKVQGMGVAVIHGGRNNMG